ncbi:dihydroxy-acid dehydratase [Aminobacter sp. Piv2-1]|uniref:dihydroxy-acid dehydratase n=1 Tax=Aminobacter sp. Piv2-1 TaxID=3031122 RepID=UPI0030A141D3
MRSHDWFKRGGLHGFIYRSWVYNGGLTRESLDGRPVIGIANSWSELTPCNRNLRQLADLVKQGVIEAGGLPLEFPVMSLGETLMRPTAMMFRNLSAMAIEETIRANPMDAVVLLTGCDKTTPAAMMGAASAGLPSILLSAGPMTKSFHNGAPISVTQMWKFSEERRAGRMSDEEFAEIELKLNASEGHCPIMGTASTMASLVEILGLSLPGNAAAPATSAERRRLAVETGKAAVLAARSDEGIASYCDRRSLQNAIVLLSALGGSTNAVIHLIAFARRIGIQLTVDDFDKLSDAVPNLANIEPSGHFAMEDYYRAGGTSVVINELIKGSLVDGTSRNFLGHSLSSLYASSGTPDQKVIFSVDQPYKNTKSIAVVRGNLAPMGAIVKVSAASKELLEHEGPAYVFDNVDVMRRAMADPNFDVPDDTVLVLRNCGPKGYPGMAEVANMPLPKKVLERGVRDMVRVSDARMSGSAFGTVVLHVSPEASSGGPLSLVETGDRIRLSLHSRSIDLLVDEAILDKRRAELQSFSSDRSVGGYRELYAQFVNEAADGADFSFLVHQRPVSLPLDNH